MAWIKIKDTLINLNNVSFIQKRNNKIIISPVLEIITKNNEYAEKIFNLICEVIKFGKNKNFIDLDKEVKEYYNFDINEAIEF